MLLSLAQDIVTGPSYRAWLLGGTVVKHKFWHNRWARKEIGFHEGKVNQYLQAYWPALGRPGAPVFVPLCGKARDLWWLSQRGHPVIGVELSEIACREFFEEASVKVEAKPGGPFTRYVHNDLQLWCGDFFQLMPGDLSAIQLVYDRAALIALPPEMRPGYAAHLTAILPGQAEMLLITLDYRNDEMQGPPFNVSDAEVRELYGSGWTIDQLLTASLAEDHPFAKRKGLSGATESVFRLRKTGSQRQDSRILENASD